MSGVTKLSELESCLKQAASTYGEILPRKESALHFVVGRY